MTIIRYLKSEEKTINNKKKVFDVEVLARGIHAHISTKRMPVTRSVDVTHTNGETQSTPLSSGLF